VGICKCEVSCHSFHEYIFFSICEPDFNTLQSKYIVPPSAEKWVMQSIRDSWRVFKYRIKKDHYYKYGNDADRWKHRPSRAPEPHFKVLLEYWNDPTIKVPYMQSF